MLGDLVYETRGKITGTQVRDDDSATIEISGQEKGTILGINCTVTVTFWASPQSDGTLSGGGRAVIITEEGDVAKYKGICVGPPGKPSDHSTGQATLRNLGAVRFFTESSRLAPLTKYVMVFEDEQNGDGTYRMKGWEWK